MIEEVGLSTQHHSVPSPVDVKPLPQGHSFLHPTAIYGLSVPGIMLASREHNRHISPACGVIA